MGKLIQVWLNNEKFDEINNFIEEMNIKLFPAKLQISTFMREITIKYIDNYRKDNE
jgi:hypothetical protein